MAPLPTITGLLQDPASRGRRCCPSPRGRAVIAGATSHTFWRLHKGSAICEDTTPPGFTFVDGFATALTRAREAAGDKAVSIMGGADVIRQALGAREVDELAVSVAPVILGGGKRLFDGFPQTVELEQLAALSSPWATRLRYRVI